MHDRIRMRTKRTRGDSLVKIIVELNPTLRGWFNYFKHAHPNTFIWVDSFVRLRAIRESQEKRPGSRRL
jgi:RNA-directed DNA polymerase